jgi:hypothetical protein
MWNHSVSPLFPRLTFISDQIELIADWDLTDQIQELRTVQIYHYAYEPSCKGLAMLDPYRIYDFFLIHIWGLLIIDY